MKVDLRYLAEFMRSMAWPVLAALMIFMFRKQIADVLTQIARRLRASTTPETVAELQKLPELVSSWSVGLVDVRKATPPQVFNGSSHGLFQQLLGSIKADYAVVDLGKGQEWLTTRLFMFSLLLGMMGGIRALVFLESSNGTRRKFLGIAAPLDVQKALAGRYPWLEEAWLKASAAVYSDKTSEADGPACSYDGEPLFCGAGQEMVADFVQQFIRLVQSSTDPPARENEAYVTVGTEPETWERAQWVDGERLERDLGGCLEFSWCQDSPDKSRKAIANAVMRRSSPLVALVDSDRRFLGLVDRVAVLDTVKQIRA
jgi:hypothetical protein